MESGNYLEYNAAGDCNVFGPDGNLVQMVKIADDVPEMVTGANQLRFDCDHAPAVNLRVRVTTLTTGMPIE